jgi:hypothetical protein
MSPGGLGTYKQPSRNRKLRTRLLVREGAPYQQTHNCLKIILKKEEKLVSAQMGACQ